MKNIHILPTEMPSRLYYNRLDKTYQLCEFHKYGTGIKSTHNIYITSDEEMKANEWFYSPNTNSPQVYGHNDIPKDRGFKKIILTTDSDLINSGVQAIHDEFLEWFVKNPSYEEIETQLKLPWESSKDEYEIIIPKEESCDNCNNEVCCCMIRKQETLEEAAKRILGNNIDGLRDAFNDDDLFYFYREVIENYGEEMAKWQKKRSYSEEEVNEIIAEAWNSCEDNEGETFTEARKRILKQFKKH